MSEPTVSEIVPSPARKHSDPHDALADLREPATARPAAMLSPTLSAANFSVSKRQSSSTRVFGSARESSFGGFANTLVRDQHSFVRQRVQRELGASVDSHVFNTSFEGFLEWIRSERMMSLPHKGGTWDRVLIAAQYFAEQVYNFNSHIHTFTEDCGIATNFMFGQCVLLLRLGHENGPALEKVFDLFYQFGLELSPLIVRHDLFRGSKSIMEGLGRAFADLLQIVTGISINFFQAVHSGRPDTRIDIFTSFRVVIDTFRRQIHQCSHEMWNVALSIRNADGCQVDDLQKWLAPKDSVLAFLSSDHINVACRPEQFTCTWFQPHLTSFLKGREKVLVIEGKSGSGKTTLANWVVNRLQRQIARKHVATISFFFNSTVTAQSSSLAMLRTLLNQLLSTHIGNIDLFEAVNEAYSESKKLNAEQQEAVMWRFFSKALHAVAREEKDSIAIVIDGMSDAEPATQQSCKQLYDIIQKHAGVRLIQFSQSLSQKPPSCVRVKLSLENILDDLRTIVRRRLHVYEHFKDRDFGDQESIIEKIATTADGSMLWSYLACRLLLRQSSCKAFDDTLKTLTTSSATVHDVVKKLYGSLNLDNDCKSLLSLLVIAVRPLRIVEAEALLHAFDNSLNVRSMLRHISPLLITTEGLISIRHNAVKQAVADHTPDAQKNKDAHLDMLIRLFASTNLSLGTEHEPTLGCLEVVQVENKLQSQPLLEYAVRYWTLHFKRTKIYKADGALQLPDELKKSFSQSVTLCLLEQACWNAQNFTQEALNRHMIAFRFRKTLFGENNACVLQSALYCATLCETFSSRRSEAVEWYALAARIGKVVVGVQSEITVTCCNMLLQISETLITKKRTTIMTYREEILLILVTSYEHRYGSSSKEVLEIYKRLHALYVHIEEETKVTEILKIIQKLTIIIYGGHSHEAESISREAQVVLKGHKHKEDVVTRDNYILIGYKEERLEITFEWIEERIREAVRLISIGEFYRAEELYIEIWFRLGEHCHHRSRECVWHEKKIHVMLLYVEFLRSQKRETEAGAILVAIWTEYEHHELAMFESIVYLLRKVAMRMLDIKMLTVALLVLNKCWAYFKHQHKIEVAVEIKSIITKTSKEIVEITKKTTEVTQKTSEKIIRTVFETSITSEETIDISTVELCESLMLIYQQEQRWSEAITCVKKLLFKSWSTFYSDSFESILLAESFSSESIRLVISLAECYKSMRRYEKAEEIYVRLYRCYRNHFKVDHVEVIKYKKELLKFYAEYEMFTKAISFYQELLVEYRAYYGTSHEETIKILYRLGFLCRQHSTNYGYWLEYYLEILVNINKGDLICKERAWEALLIVAEHYYETLRYSESLVYFKSIFATFYKLDISHLVAFEKVFKVSILIEHFFRSIEESKTEISVHIHILKELREACLRFYREEHSITIHVTVMLAETMYRSEEYRLEAISYYESVMKYEKTVSQQIIKRTKTSLKILYVEQIKSETTSTTVTKETLERATKMVYESYVEVRQSYSYSHEITMKALSELVLLYHKQQKIEAIYEELRQVIHGCIIEANSASVLIEAATSLVAIYRSCGLVSWGLEIVRELKLQIIYGVYDGNSSKIKFDVRKIGRACFAFIAAFEYHLREIYSISLTLYMSDLVAEYIYYERLVHYIQHSAHLEMIFICASRLEQILVRTKRAGDFAIIEGKVLEYFKTTETFMTKKVVTVDAARIFIRIILGHFSRYSTLKSWTAVVGHAAVDRLTVLLKEHKYKDALDLTNCTFHFLMAHEGLDDPTEITLGFQLALMMAGRADDKSLNDKCKDPVIEKGMMDLSRKILAEVFDICEKSEFNLVQCQLTELNSLIRLVGDQKDYVRLQWLLQLLWSSREGQKKWSTDTVLKLGKRLVQAQFAANKHTPAIRLCENIVYNVRRVHGLRHHYTASFQDLLASMYITLGLRYIGEASSKENANKKHAQEMAQVYFKKAIQVHEDVLKQIVNDEDADNSDYDDDESSFNDIMSNHRGGVNGDAFHPDYVSKHQELDSVRKHIRGLHLAVQRYGGFVKSGSNYDTLTTRVWEQYGKEPGFNMSQDQVLSKKWKIDAYGSGKAEAAAEEDGFRSPSDWKIMGSRIEVVQEVD